MNHHFYELLSWDKPVHFIWGCADQIFTEAWGRAWAERLGASFDPIADANHFLQNTHGSKVVERILARSETGQRCRR
ncbi:MAG: alpha/beta fold hydrolase [Acidimicrobiales bacterium]